MTAEEIRYKHHILDSLRNAQNWADFIGNTSISTHVWRTIQSAIEEVNASFD